MPGIVSQQKLQTQITPNADQLRLGWANLVEKIPLSYATHCRAWTSKQDTQLRKGVHFQLQQARLLTDQRMSLEELAGVSLQPLSTLLVPGGLDVIARDADAIDWGEVVRMHMPYRTIDDCRLRWMNLVDPRVCADEWTDDEDEELCRLIDLHKDSCDWFIIADSLHASKLTPGGLVRSPYQCAARYQAEFNPSLVKSSWTPEEDEFIKAWIRDNGPGNWTKLARLLPGHTGQQVLHRWRRLEPTRRKGAWTEEEDDALRLAVGAYRSGERIKWSLVAEHVPTRSDVQCRERWTGVIDPSIKTGSWSEEEDDALLSAMGPSFDLDLFNEWAKLTVVVPGRTSKACMRRVRTLLRKRRKDTEEKEKNKATGERRRGRPRKISTAAQTDPVPEPLLVEPLTKRRRGRSAG
jgi:myb proto-oncogene protein